MAKDAKAKGPGAEDSRCRLCDMPLVKAATTLGHNKSVCKVYKAKMAKEAAKKAKAASSKK